MAETKRGFIFLCSECGEDCLSFVGLEGSWDGEEGRWCIMHDHQPGEPGFNDLRVLCGECVADVEPIKTETETRWIDGVKVMAWEGWDISDPDYPLINYRVYRKDGTVSSTVAADRPMWGRLSLDNIKQAVEEVQEEDRLCRK